MRLRTDRIDLPYQHRIGREVPIEDVAGAVNHLMGQGKVLHWGLPEMGLNTLRRVHAALPVTAVQNECLMLWREPERDVIPTCWEPGLGFVPWSPLGLQLLTGWIDANTRFAPGDISGGESRLPPESLPHNLQLVALVKPGGRAEAGDARADLARLAARPEAVDRAHPGDDGHGEVCGRRNGQTDSVLCQDGPDGCVEGCR